MPNKKTIKIISWAIILAVVFYLFWATTVNGPRENEPQATERQQQGQVELTIAFEDDKKDLFFDYEPGDTIFDLLKKADEQGEIEIKYRDFGGELGIFLESIDGVGGDEDKWWQYWVNGEYGQIGISAYFVSSGDSIEFKYEGSNE